MTARELICHRLHNQQIVEPRAKSPEELIFAFGAMQAQDYASSLWAIGLRLPGSTEREIEQAVIDRKIIRTWLMRGTLHWVAAEDIRWMLALLTPRILENAASRERALELDKKTFSRCRKILAKALSRDRQLSRQAIFALLETANTPTTAQRGYHILWRLSQEGFLCCAARDGKTQTFALLDDWVPQSPAHLLKREEALAKLAHRYVTSHGPVTLYDFAWWSGLTVADTRNGLAAILPRTAQFSIHDTTYWSTADPPTKTAHNISPPKLLPSFDEYLLGYKDRSAVLAPAHVDKIVPGNNGIFLPVILSRGRVIGTWKRFRKDEKRTLSVNWFDKNKALEKRAVAYAAAQYSDFLNRSVTKERKR